MKPLVSIITPSYNQSKYIENAILSVRNQTYKRIEHIIVDGGSTDSTVQILKKYEQNYNMKWLSEKDEGMYHAINKGLLLAEGEIIAYLNCDDYYFPWSVAVAVESLENENIVYGDIIRINMEKEEISFNLTPPFNSFYYRVIGVINQPSVFFKKKLIRRIGQFSQEFLNVADCEYWLRCDAAGYRPKKVYEIMAVETWHSESRNSRNAGDIGKEFAVIRRKYARWMTRCAVPFRVYMHVYWRIAFLLYLIKVPNLWCNFRKHDLLDLGWRDIVEVLPARIRRNFGEKSKCRSFWWRFQRMLEKDIADVEKKV